MCSASPHEQACRTVNRWHNAEVTMWVAQGHHMPSSHAIIVFELEELHLDIRCSRVAVVSLQRVLDAHRHVVQPRWGDGRDGAVCISNAR